MLFMFQHERQMEKEETVQMTVELDEQWKSLHSLISKNKMKVGYFHSYFCSNL
jgi:hypothetical protein